MSIYAQFLVFQGCAYYPCGGFDDFANSYSEREQAEAAIRSLDGNYDWAQIVDIQTGTVDHWHRSTYRSGKLVVGWTKVTKTEVATFD